MTIKARAGLNKGRQLINGKITGTGHYGVKRYGTVALAHDESITFRVMRLFGIVLQHMKIEAAQNIGHRQVTADVAHSGGTDRLNDQLAHTVTMAGNLRWR